MKKIILLGLFLIPLIGKSQNGYFNIGASALFEKKKMNNSLTMGAGYRIKQLSAGITTDAYWIDKAKPNFIIAAFDFRRYVKGFYLSLQPGYTLQDKMVNHIVIKGSYAGAAMIGYEWKFLNLSAGYQYYSFKVLGEMVRDNAVKINLSAYLK